MLDLNSRIQFNNLVDSAVNKLWLGLEWRDELKRAIYSYAIVTLGNCLWGYHSVDSVAGWQVGLA